MESLLAVTLNALQQDMQRLDVVAHNLANVSTIGYKREVLATQPFVDVVDQMRATTAAVQGSGVATSGFPLGPITIRSDSRPGTLRMTGRPLDVALTGEGFFEITTPNGPAYTRQGSFQVDAQGRLVSADGYPVAGKNGDIMLVTQQPVIDATGSITEPDAPLDATNQAPGTSVAQLKIVQFDETSGMKPLGEGLLSEGSGMSVVQDVDTHLRQGALENANVDNVQEMLQLMQAMRHAESMQKIATGYDEMLDTALRKLGDLS